MSIDGVEAGLSVPIPTRTPAAISFGAARSRSRGSRSSGAVQDRDVAPREQRDLLVVRLDAVGSADTLVEHADLLELPDRGRAVGREKQVRVLGPRPRARRDPELLRLALGEMRRDRQAQRVASRVELGRDGVRSVWRDAEPDELADAVGDSLPLLVEVGDAPGVLAEHLEVHGRAQAELGARHGRGAGEARVGRGRDPAREACGRAGARNRDVASQSTLRFRCTCVISHGPKSSPSPKPA